MRRRRLGRLPGLPIIGKNMKMQHDNFESWIRERCSGCMESSEIDELCKGDLDFESGEYTFSNQSVQAQWEAWKAALAN